MAGMKPFPDTMMEELRKEHGGKPRATLEQLMAAHKRKGKGATVHFGVPKNSQRKEQRATRSERHEKMHLAIRKTYADFLDQAGLSSLDGAETLLWQTDADLIAAYSRAVFRDETEAVLTDGWFKYMP